MKRKIVSRWPLGIFELSDVKILVYLEGKKIGSYGATLPQLSRVLKNQSTLRKSLCSLVKDGMIEERARGCVISYILTRKGGKFATHLVLIRGLLEKSV